MNRRTRKADGAVPDDVDRHVLGDAAPARTTSGHGVHQGCGGDLGETMGDRLTCLRCGADIGSIARPAPEVDPDAVTAVDTPTAIARAGDERRGATDAATVLRDATPTEPVAQFFAYEHLPPNLQDVSRPFAALAARMINTLPVCGQRTVALQHLLEAKDAAVRARIGK